MKRLNKKLEAILKEHGIEWSTRLEDYVLFFVGLDGDDYAKEASIRKIANILQEEFGLDVSRCRSERGGDLLWFCYYRISEAPVRECDKDMNTAIIMCAEAVIND